MRAPSGRWPRLGVVALFMVVVLIGCSEEPEPPGSLPSTAPAPTSSSGSSTPQSPKQEVEAAVRAYYAELTRAAQTNDTSKLRTMVTKGCPCYEPIRIIERGAKRGEKAPDAKWIVRSVDVHDVNGRTAVAEVRYDVSGYDVIDESGEVLGHVKPQKSHFDLSLIRAPHGWIIGNLVELSGER